MKCALKREVHKKYEKFSRYVLTVEWLSTYTHYPLSRDLHFTSRGVYKCSFRTQIMRKNQIEIYGMRCEVIETAAMANGVKIHTMHGHLQVILSSLYQFHVPAVSFRSINGNIFFACIDHAMVAFCSPSSCILFNLFNFCILMSVYVILLISMGNKNKQRR